MKSITKYFSPAKTWTEAQPLGNGQLGAMVFGGISEEIICLNHDTLWNGIPQKTDIPNVYDALIEAREYIKNNDYVNAHRIINENCLGRRGVEYMPFGNMTLSFRNIKTAGSYKRELDLENAVVTVNFTDDDAEYKREYFISYPDKVMVIKLSADKKEKISFDMSLSSPFEHNIEICQDNLYLYGECPGVVTVDYKMQYSKSDAERGIGFCGASKVLTFGEKAEIAEKDGKIAVSNADEALVIFSIETSFNGFDKHPYLEGKEYKENVKSVVKRALEKGYEKLIDTHRKDFSSLYNRVSLDLGESGKEDMPTDERLKLFQNEKNDISLYTLLFDFGRYLAISSARGESQISNLQGIWNDSIDPPWGSNYTLNINTQMNQWPLLMCNLKECFEPFIKFMKNISVSGEFAAKNMYHARGFVMHSNTDIWLKSTPSAGDARFAFWNGSSGWLCRNLYEFYQYTQDKDYLKNVCYPIMKKAAQFYLDILEDRGDGVLSVIPATSPENGFWYTNENGEKQKVAVAKYAAMSDCIVYDLFQNCISAINSGNIADSEFETSLQTALKNMSPLKISEDGRLCEWNEDFEEYEINHRHVSHLYALHPADLINVNKTPELAQACRKTLEKRGDDGTGWSLAWKVNFFARLNEGNHALELINKMLKLVDSNEISYEAEGGIYSNMFDAHPPFQIDGNFGVVSGIIEMLVRCENGDIEFLPSIPDAWKNGKLTGVCVKGNKFVDIEWKDNKLVSKRIYS